MSIMVRSLLSSLCSTTSPLGNVNGPSSCPVEYICSNFSQDLIPGKEKQEAQ